jgi:ankyrin repeat protein
MYYQSASSGTSAVKVPRRRGYDPGQDSIYQSQQTPELATSPSADAPNSTAPWNFDEQFRPFQQKISSFLASAQTAIATSKLEDSGRSNKKKQKRLDVLLCAAAASGDLSLINNLLDAGADPLSASSGGVSSSKQTALHWAAAGRQFAAFLTLQHCTCS